MARFIQFTDFFTAKPLALLTDSEDAGKKDFFSLFKKPVPRRFRAKEDNTNLVLPKSLGAKIAATHAARVTGNHGFYLPDKMKNGAGTWLAPFAKPILLHHEKTDDAIGRVRDARYVDISQGFRADMIKRKDSITDLEVSDNLIDAFFEGKLEPTQVVDVVRFCFLDQQFAKDPSYPGVGYIELTASITDPDSIKKVIDQRYLTGSIGARTDAAICSICKKDWADDSFCDHRPGKTYKVNEVDTVCVLIAGNLIYSEYSFVNAPADDLSQTLELFVDGEKKDSISTTVAKDSIYEVAFDLEDSLTEFEAETDLVLSDSQQEVVQEPEKELSEQERLINSLKETLGDSFEEVIGTEPTVSDLLYGQMFLDLEGEDLQKLVDAKLSAAARKKLPASTFCGPDKSFPVGDCAHFSAALRLLGKYKGPGDKNRIRACIERKGSRLGCTSKSKKDTIGIGQFNLDWFDKFEDDELLQLQNGLTAAMKERGMEEYVENKVADSNIECEEIKNKLEQLDSLQKELATAYETQNALDEQMSKVTKELKENFIDFVIFINGFTGATINKDELITKTEDELRNMLNVLYTQVDSKQIFEKINSGLTKDAPQQTVEDPTLGFRQEVKDEVKKPVVIDAERLAEIRDCAIKILVNQGFDKAKAFVEKFKAQGVLPPDIETINFLGGNR